MFSAAMFWDTFRYGGVNSGGGFAWFQRISGASAIHLLRELPKRLCSTSPVAPPPSPSIAENAGTVGNHQTLENARSTHIIDHRRMAGD